MACSLKDLYNWDNNGYEDCGNNNWLLGENIRRWEQWTMTPCSSEDVIMVYLTPDVFVAMIDSFYAMTVRPVVYLKPDVKIMSGDGTKTNPFVLGA